MFESWITHCESWMKAISKIKDDFDIEEEQKQKKYGFKNIKQYNIKVA
jgi:hypothetical protein